MSTGRKSWHWVTDVSVMGGEGYIGDIDDASIEEHTLWPRMNWHHIKESWTSGGLPSSERWDTYIARTRKGIFFIRISDSTNPDDIVEIGDENAVLEHGLFKKGEPSLEEVCVAVEGIRGFGKLCKMIKEG